jgi:hypothetical protein
MVGLSQFGTCLPECLPDKRSLGTAPSKAPPKWLVLELLVEEIKDFNNRSILCPRSPSACTRNYGWSYGADPLMDTFCYAFWAPAISVPDYIEWNLSKALACIAHVGIFNSAQIQFWLSRRVPHLIFAIINL